MVRLDGGIARAVYHWIFDSRSTAAAREVMGEYRGNVVADGYEPYQRVARAGLCGAPRCTLVFCSAHVRRKYVEAEVFEPACAEVIKNHYGSKSKPGTEVAALLYSPMDRLQEFRLNCLVDLEHSADDTAHWLFMRKSHLIAVGSTVCPSPALLAS